LGPIPQRQNGGVEAGAGLFDVLPLPYQFILLTTQAAPFFQYTSLKVGDPSLCAASDISACESGGHYPANKIALDLCRAQSKRNYVTQWNLNVSVPAHHKPGSHGRLLSALAASISLSASTKPT